MKQLSFLADLVPNPHLRKALFSLAQETCSVSAQGKNSRFTISFQDWQDQVTLWKAEQRQGS